MFIEKLRAALNIIYLSWSFNKICRPVAENCADRSSIDVPSICGLSSEGVVIDVPEPSRRKSVIRKSGLSDSETTREFFRSIWTDG